MALASDRPCSRASSKWFECILGLRFTLLESCQSSDLAITLFYQGYNLFSLSDIPVTCWDVSKSFQYNPTDSEMSRCIRKPTICVCENKGADQLCSNCTADQRLCFRYTDSTIPLLLKYKISSFQVCFCDCTARFLSDLVGTQVVGFLSHRLKSIQHQSEKLNGCLVEDEIFKVNR